MGFAYTYEDSKNLLVVQIWGEMPYSEEVKAVSETFADGLIKPDVKILVDRTRAKFHSTPEEVKQHVEFIAQKMEKLGTPKVANVVSANLDFGMIRMFDILADGKIQHQFRVFKGIDDACKWLSVDIADVNWPKYIPELDSV